MKRKIIIFLGIALLLIVSFKIWRYIDSQKIYVFPEIGVQLPKGSKYIHKEYDYSMTRELGYYIIQIPIDQSNEFENALPQAKWTEYDVSLLNTYFQNNYCSRFILDEIPIAGIEHGWFIFLDGTNSGRDKPPFIGNIIASTWETVRQFYFYIYDPETSLLYELNCYF